MGFFPDLFETIGDVAVGALDTTLGSIGAGNIISNGAYSSSKAANTQKQIGGVTNAIVDAGVNFFIPGAGPVLGVAQKIGNAGGNVATTANRQQGTTTAYSDNRVATGQRRGTNISSVRTASGDVVSNNAGTVALLSSNTLGSGKLQYWWIVVVGLVLYLFIKK